MPDDDLFSWRPPYPHAPGWKEPTTSRDAAEAVEPSASRLRGDVLTVYRAAWPAGLTADEAAARLGRTVLSVRPRVSELRKQGELMTVSAEPAPGTKLLRRKNESGLMAAVLVCKKPTKEGSN